MRKILLAGVAALLLGTGAVQAQEFTDQELAPAVEWVKQMIHNGKDSVFQVTFDAARIEAYIVDQLQNKHSS
jgi:hypothetical protein